MIAQSALVLLVTARHPCLFRHSLRAGQLTVKGIAVFSQSLFVLLVTTLFFACNIARAIQTN